MGMDISNTYAVPLNIPLIICYRHIQNLLHEDSTITTILEPEYIDPLGQIMQKLN